MGIDIWTSGHLPIRCNHYTNYPYNDLTKLLLLKPLHVNKHDLTNEKQNDLTDANDLTVN